MGSSLLYSTSRSGNARSASAGAPPAFKISSIRYTSAYINAWHALSKTASVAADAVAYSDAETFAASDAVSARARFFISPSLPPLSLPLSAILNEDPNPRASAPLEPDAPKPVFPTDVTPVTPFAAAATVAAHQRCKRASAAARNAGGKNAARARNDARYAADASLPAGGWCGSVTRSISASAIRPDTPNAPPNEDEDAEREETEKAFSVRPASDAAAKPPRGTTPKGAFSFKGVPRAAAASLAQTWNTRNCVNLEVCAGSSVLRKMESTASATACPSPRSMRTSTCASAASIIESSASAASSTAACDFASPATPEDVVGLVPCLALAKCPPLARASRSHTAACLVISISMVFSMSSSSKMPAPPTSPSASPSTSPSMSSSTSSSLESSPSAGSRMCSQVISTSTCSRCDTTPPSSASRSRAPGSVSASANAARRYCVCAFLCAETCGRRASRMGRSTEAASGTSVRMVSTARTTPAVTASGGLGVVEGETPRERDRRDPDPSTFSRTPFADPGPRRPSRSRSARSYPGGGTKFETSISRHVCRRLPVCVETRLTQNSTTSAATSSAHRHSDVESTLRSRSSCAFSSRLLTHSTSTVSISSLSCDTRASSSPSNASKSS